MAGVPGVLETPRLLLPGTAVALRAELGEPAELEAVLGVLPGCYPAASGP